MCERLIYRKIMRHLLVAVASISLTQCGGVQKRSARSPVASVSTAQFEREFLQNRIAHQQAAVDMTQSCIQKGQHDQLKQFCSELRTREQEELNQLQEWSKTWYGTAPVPLQSREQKTEGYRNFLASVRSSSGAQFDQALLSALRLHHHEGARESEGCAKGAVHRELKMMCETVQTEQEREIKQMSAWICEWFKDCMER